MEKKQLYSILMIIAIVVLILIILLIFLNQPKSPIEGLTQEEIEVRDVNIKQDAINNLDEGGCEGITDAETKQACLNQVGMDQAVRSGDYEACLALEVGKENCIANYYIGLAIANQDKSYCDNINTPQYKTVCLSKVS